MTDRRDRERREDDYELPSAREWAQQQEVGGGRTSLKIPAGVGMFSVKKPGNVYLDFVPFRAGEGNPGAAKGKPYWQRIYGTHRSIGAGQDTYCCPNYCSQGKRPCPICEDVQRQYKRMDPSLDNEEREKERKRIGDAGLKIRQLFCVIDRDNKDAGIQVWDVSFHLFGKTLQERLNGMDEDDNFDQFYHPKRGLTVKITALEKSLPGSRPFCDCSIFEFKPRKEPYEMSIIDQAPCLDDMLKVLPYDRLGAIYLGADVDQELPERGHTGNGSGTERKSARKVEPKDQDDDDDERPVRKVKEDKDEEKPKRGLFEDHEDDLPPKRGSTKPPPADDDDEEDDEPTSPRSEPNAAELGIEVGMLVYYNDMECKVTHVSRDGASLKLEDEDEIEYRAVSPSEVRARKKKPAPDDPGARKSRKADDDDEDETPAPRSRRK